MRLRLAAILALGIALPALAQTDIRLSGFQADPTAPVEVAADSLSLDQTSGMALFEGNVSVTQGDTTITAGRIEVRYDDATGAIILLVATGGVSFKTKTDTARAENAEYDIEKASLVMKGGVVLTQGASSVSADSMVVNLATGAARLDGRVRTTLTQSGT